MCSLVLRRARIALPATVVIRSFADGKSAELSGVLASFGGSIQDDASRIVAHFSNADEAARAALAARPLLEAEEGEILVSEPGAAIPEARQTATGAVLATGPIRRAVRDGPDIETRAGGSEAFPFELTPAPEPSILRSLRQALLPATGIALVLGAGVWWLAEPGAPAGEAPILEDPTIRYTKTSDGVNIAYWVIGEGPVLIVNDFKVSAHIDHQWRIPEVQRWFRALASEFRVVRFSARGSGLSDPGYLESSLDEMALDMLAVTDAIGTDRVATLGIGAQGAVSTRFVTRYPERNAALLLFNAAGLYGADYDRLTDAVNATSRMSDEARMTWMMDVAAIPPEQRASYRPWLQAWADFMSPDEYARLLRKHGTWNVRDELPAVTVPTLVMQRPASLPPTQGPELASTIPNAQLVIFEGQGFMPYVGFQDDEVEVVKGFLREAFAER